MKYGYIIAGLAISLAGCSSLDTDGLIPDKQVEYKREQQAEKNLELPPDLTSSRFNDRMAVLDNFAGVGTNYSEYVVDRNLRGQGGAMRTGGSVLPANPDMRIERDGDVRWLVVKADPDALWDRVLDFWQDQGVILVEQDPEVGLMQTDWLENLGNLGSDIITKTLSGIMPGMYDTGFRDAYRLRFERSGELTEIFMTHYGMEQKLTGSELDRVRDTIWEKRERDPELEVVMLRRLMIFLGAAEDRASAQLAAASKYKKPRATLMQDEQGAKLVISEEFQRAWRFTGLALDRIGFAVEDRNRQAGIYYVTYNDPAASKSATGFLDSLKFWSDEEQNNKYEIHVKTEDAVSSVSVHDDKGVVLNTDTAKRMLNLLQQQLR